MTHERYGVARSGRRRLIALVQKAPGIAPHQRFRIEQWSPWLSREHGIDVELLPFESPALTDVLYQPGKIGLKARLALRDAVLRWRGRHALLEADAVLVVREASLIGGAWLERWLARQGVPFIYDFDDAIWTVEPSASNGLMSLARMPWKVGPICRMAGAVTVGNEYLAEFARRHSQHVHLVRTSIDTDRHTPQPGLPPDAPFTIVWTGSHSTLPYLELVRPALERIGAHRPTVLRVICDRSPAPFQNVRLEFVPWHAEIEATALAQAHVGIMPVPDTAFARGKCGCKALQYMAVGRPAVVSPVGVNTEIVRDGENGLFAGSEDAWVRTLERLAADAAFRNRLAEAGRRTVVESFSARASAAGFALAVTDAMTRRQMRGDRSPRY